MCIIQSLADFVTSFKLYVSLLGSLCLSACDSEMLIYAGKQGIQQGGLQLKARSNQDLLKDPNTPENIKDYIALSESLLDHSAKALRMKVGNSYRKYIHLDREWVTQVITVAHKDRLELKLFEFPIVGQVPYKGFFNLSSALKEASKYEQLGFDVFRGGVPAYSSIGWFDDPLYSTMFKGKAYLISLLFHELVHLNFYFKDMANFNEAFATWFSNEVSKDFINASTLIQEKDAVLKDLLILQQEEESIALFSQEALALAREGYKNKESRTKIFSKIEKLLHKYPLISNKFSRSWNNASLLSLSTYYELVPRIERFAQQQGLTAIELLHRITNEGKPLSQTIIGQSQ